MDLLWENGYDLVDGRHSEKFRDLVCVIYFFKYEAKLTQSEERFW